MDLDDANAGDAGLATSASPPTPERERPGGEAPRPEGGAWGQPMVQVLPLRVKLVGLGLLPVWVPLKPMLVEAPGAMVPL